MLSQKFIIMVCLLCCAINSVNAASLMSACLKEAKNVMPTPAYINFRQIVAEGCESVECCLLLIYSFVGNNLKS